MAFQPVPDTVEVDILYTQLGEAVQNVLYAEIPGGYTQADLVVLAAVIDAQVQGTWKSQQVVDSVYVRTEVRGLAVVNDITAMDNSNAGPGVKVGASLPNNCTLVVKKSSGQTGRSARGRLYWIGVARGELEPNDDNLFLAAYVTAVVAAVDSMRTAIIGAPNWNPVLVSRFTAGAARPFGIRFPWLASSAVDNRVDTQRNRLP